MIAKYYPQSTLLMPNATLFTGEDAYSLWQHLQHRKSLFIQKYSEHACIERKWDPDTVSSVTQAMQSWWMFGQKTLCIIHGVPKDLDPTYWIPVWTQQWLQDRLMNNRDSLDNETCILLFVCRKPDKRTKGRKFFESRCTVKSFSTPSAKSTQAFLTERVWSLLSPDQLASLADRVQWDLRSAHHSAEKITAYAHFNTLSSLSDEQVQSILTWSKAADPFALIDALLTDKDRAYSLIDTLRTDWANEFQTLWMLYRWLKIIIQTTALTMQWVTDSKQIAKRIKAPPFAVSKHLKHRDLYQREFSRLTWVFQSLIFLDENIKTWKQIPEAFWVWVKRAVAE